MSQAGDQSAVAVRGVGMLADNGGQALTLALDRTNPAVDPGNDSQCEAVDQRGVARPIDGNGNGNGNGGAVRDVGAFEFSGVPFRDGF